MSTIALVSQAVNFIEDHLKQPVTVADMAEAVSYSLYYFCRVFSQIARHTPYDYLMRRRLSEAARELLAGDKLILDVALDYQFNNPETFSRAFKRMFATQPSQLRRQGWIDTRWLMPRLTRAYLEHINQGGTLKPELVEKGAFQVAGVMTLVQEDRSVIGELWRLFARQLADRGEQAGWGDYYGLICYPEAWRGEGALYMAAVEIATPDVVDLTWTIKTVPACRYARFTHHGPWRALSRTWDYVYHTWLPKSGERMAYPLALEHYGRTLPRQDDASSGWGVDVPLQRGHKDHIREAGLGKASDAGGAR